MKGAAVRRRESGLPHDRIAGRGVGATSNHRINRRLTRHLVRHTFDSCPAPAIGRYSSEGP
jgi:hypothetical protein